MESIAIACLGGPLAVALAGLYGLNGRAEPARRVAEGASLAAIAGAVFSLVLLVTHGHATTTLFGDQRLGLSVRLDAVSVTMALLVSFIGWVVVRYAATYLDGEPRQAPFIGWLSLTLACVLILVTAGGVWPFAAAWIATSFCLHRLLLFYPERPGARRAARKKFMTARLGDVSLIAAFGLLAARYGTADIEGLVHAVRTEGGGAATTAAAALFALAAILKSAQFPTHGWLIDVMETPTPVSALLHAGVVNGGGFLLIRFADVMLTSPGVLAALAAVGGFSALFGGLVMLTQPAVKTSLAWSTVAQMGFMLLECGLALFPLALLHIVAHSLYKAHAFLSSGGAVETIAANRRPGPVAAPGAGAVARAFLLALGLYVAIGLGFGFAHKSPQAVALGAILIFGIAYLFAQGLADLAPRALTRRTAVAATLASVSYFALQALSEAATAGVLPPAPAPGPLQWTIIVVAVISFGLTAVVQAMFPLWANHPAAAGLRVHLSNGFYANALFDRLIQGWSTSTLATKRRAT